MHAGSHDTFNNQGNNVHQSIFSISNLSQHYDHLVQLSWSLWRRRREREGEISTPYILVPCL